MQWSEKPINVVCIWDDGKISRDEWYFSVIFEQGQSELGVSPNMIFNELKEGYFGA